MPLVSVTIVTDIVQEKSNRSVPPACSRGWHRAVMFYTSGFQSLQDMINHAAGPADGKSVIT